MIKDHLTPAHALHSVHKRRGIKKMLDQWVREGLSSGVSGKILQMPRENSVAAPSLACLHPSMDLSGSAEEAWPSRPAIVSRRRCGMTDRATMFAMKAYRVRVIVLGFAPGFAAASALAPSSARTALGLVRSRCRALSRSNGGDQRRGFLPGALDFGFEADLIFHFILGLFESTNAIPRRQMAGVYFAEVVNLMQIGWIFFTRRNILISLKSYASDHFRSCEVLLAIRLYVCTSVRPGCSAPQPYSRGGAPETIARTRTIALEYNWLPSKNIRVSLEIRLDLPNGLDRQQRANLEVCQVACNFMAIRIPDISRVAYTGWGRQSPCRIQRMKNCRWMYCI